MADDATVTAGFIGDDGELVESVPCAVERTTLTSHVDVGIETSPFLAAFRDADSKARWRKEDEKRARRINAAEAIRFMAVMRGLERGEYQEHLVADQGDRIRQIEERRNARR